MVIKLMHSLSEKTTHILADMVSIPGLNFSKTLNFTSYRNRMGLYELG
jgi:hypothetical protein